VGGVQKALAVAAANTVFAAAEEVASSAVETAQPSRDSSMHVSSRTHVAAATSTAIRLCSFRGALASACYAIELCCGNGGYSAELSRAGFCSLPVDHAPVRRQVKVPVVRLDLALTEGWRLLDELSLAGRIYYVHAAPPCGTASQGRSNASASAPLRDKSSPCGLPHLRGLDVTRVETANCIYRLTAQFLSRCLKLGIYVSIENPTSSLMWLTPWLGQLLAMPGMLEVTYHQCMHGGGRKRRISWWTNMPRLAELSVSCDGLHQHLPWGESFEAAYPALLCARAAALVTIQAVSDGVLFASPAVSFASPSDPASTPALRAHAGRQPRGRKYPELVPEFHRFETHEFSRETLLSSPSVGAKLSESEASALGLPFCAKVLESDFLDGGVQVRIEFGMFHTPEEFIAAASALRHPFDGSSSIQDDVLRAAFALLVEGPCELQRCRESTFRHYESLALDFELADNAVRSRMASNRSHLIRDKKLKLFGLLCNDAGIRDDSLLATLVNGVRLTGEAPLTGEFPLKRREPLMSVEQVMRASKWNRASVAGRSCSSGDAVLDDAVWAATKEEIEGGWLSGPYDPAELRRLLGPLYVTSRRFGVLQKGKARVVDDLSDSLVNSCFGTSEAVDLGGVDEYVVLARTLLEMLKDDRSVTVSLSCGTVLAGVLHASLSLSEARTLSGRTLDLQAAYKQLLVCKSSEWASSIRVFNAEARVDQTYLAVALPFGASAAATDSTDLPGLYG
jgi:hypothetical protein